MENKPIHIIDGARTPFLKALTSVNPFSASDLAVLACQPIISRLKHGASAITEVVAGCTIPDPREANIARLIALRLGCSQQTEAYTVQRNCASGMQALDSAMKDLQLGRHQLVLAGGAEAMSRAPFISRLKFANWLKKFFATKKISQKFAALLQLPIKDLLPEFSLLIGLTDPTIGLSMGETAEILAHRFAITREDMDQFALHSHINATQAMDKSYLQEITPMIDPQGHIFSTDTGLRRDSTLEKLAKLKPAFVKKFGNVSAGNSAQVTDGAAFLLLANEQGVSQQNLTSLGKIIDVAWVGVDPKLMGLAPAYAVAKLLKQQQLSFNDIDYWEINEAFAAQVLACLKAWNDEAFCKQELGLDKPLGKINLDRINVDGGAIAIGHPVGASGARIVWHLLTVLRRKHAKRGIATLCIGGGQGGAMLIEID